MKIGTQKTITLIHFLNSASDHPKYIKFICVALITTSINVVSLSMKKRYFIIHNHFKNFNTIYQQVAFLYRGDERWEKSYHHYFF